MRSSQEEKSFPGTVVIGTANGQCATAVSRVNHTFVDSFHPQTSGMQEGVKVGVTHNVLSTRNSVARAPESPKVEA